MSKFRRRELAIVSPAPPSDPLLVNALQELEGAGRARRSFRLSILEKIKAVAKAGLQAIERSRPLPKPCLGDLDGRPDLNEKRDGFGHEPALLAGHERPAGGRQHRRPIVG